MARIFVDTAGTTTANDGQTLDAWILPLTSRLQGATESLIRVELNAAVREFFLQSNAWREQVGPFNVYSNTDLVWMNPIDAYSNVLYVHGAWLETTDQGKVLLAPWDSRITADRTGRPTHYSLPDPAVLRLWPTPDADIPSSLWIDCTLVPLPDATRLPTLASVYHFDAILEGALSRLLMIPNKPWTDPMLAARYSQTFRRRCIQARAQAKQGYTSADAPWRFPSFA